jgi:LPS sulfotransferase NodH
MDFGVIPVGEHEKRLREFFSDIDLSNVPAISELKTFTFLCFTNRCGSTYLASIASQLGLAGAADALGKNFEYLNWQQVLHHSTAHSIKSFKEYFSYIVAQHSSDYGSFLVKTSVDQFNFLINAGIFKSFRKQPHVLLMTRKNLIAQSISFNVALQDGKWTSLHGPTNNEGARKVSPEKILMGARMVGTQNVWFKLLFDFHNINAVELVYEDFQFDPAALITRLREVYGLSPDRMLMSPTLPVERQGSHLKDLWETEIRALGVLK